MEQIAKVQIDLVVTEDIDRLMRTTPHSQKLAVVTVDGQDYIALYKTERAARPFAILPLWQLVPVLDLVLSDE
tara:strand:+ start:2773 stop:2991 length:219 start_codon:yes stop_codon:yes gene_type:complete